MALETWQENRRTIDALEIEPEDAVLDIGCGHGRSISLLAERAVQGRIIGIDPSKLMIEIATARNNELIKSGRAITLVAEAIKIPFEDNSFDKILCVHVIYFWTDMTATIHEIARVLKPGGRLALTFKTNEDIETVNKFPTEIYRFPALTEVTSALMQSGLTIVNQGVGTHTRGPTLLIVTK